MKNYKEYQYKINRVAPDSYTFDIYPPIGLAEFDIGESLSSHNQADLAAKKYIDKLIEYV